ncbi:hypothetical protein [Burkholderia sp. Ac-20365]|uniref:hypothetical protein n=1 Tax=Burkholderia sp. Ac-20365 TaxID=2703897 RepID=UPI00197B7ECF|nr:hypothetical protein [Burkholderia sp. Ac-20365]MBN3760993.1 hypothetical protein [Burkholderia sp. Ac-20365]
MAATRQQEEPVGRSGYRRKMTPTEDDRAAGRVVLEHAAARLGYESWAEVLNLCSRDQAVLRIDFAEDCPFGFHEEFAASLRSVGLEMRALRFTEIVVGKPDVLAARIGEPEWILARGVVVYGLGAYSETLPRRSAC